MGYFYQSPKGVVGNFVEPSRRFLDDVVVLQGFEVWSFREGISE
jgi:hypothetical protein